VTVPSLHFGPDVPWPQTPDGDYARAYLTPFLAEGSRAQMSNVDTRVAVLRLDDLALPVTINEAEYANSYVCAPYNHYVDYARAELSTLGEPVAEAALGAALHAVGLGLRLAEINRVVHVNNWLLSTNLYPPMSREQIRAITRMLVARYPHHAVVWRSVNTVQGPGLWDAFRDEGYGWVASRQLYYQWPADDAFYNHAQRKIMRREAKLLAASPYEVLGPDAIEAAMLPRLKDLYDQLYLEKYSHHNPQFTLRFLETARVERTLGLRALRHRETGAIDGVAGYFVRNGTLTTPLFGYDLAVPQEAGLYRILTQLMVDEAKEHGWLLNMSSGAAGFKRSRGARPNIEYSMVWDHHLPGPRRAAWTLLAGLVNGVAAPLMAKNKV
jgi:hypothetical protein